jgi:uncharacterized membrane protein
MNDKPSNIVNWTNIGITTVILLILDLIFLYKMRNVYQKQIKSIQTKKMTMKIIPAILCYISIVSLLYYFIILPHRSCFESFWLGFGVYLVFETTNMSLFDKWEWNTVFIDSIWGGILFSVTTFLSYNVYKVYGTK